MTPRGRLIVAVALLVALAALVVLGGRSARWTSEAFTDLTVGRLVFETRSVPARDTLAWSSGDTRWIAQSWLGQLAAFTTWRAGGLRAVVVLHVGLLAGAALATNALARRRTKGWAAALVTLFVLGAVLVTTPLATEAWSVLLLAVTLLCLERLDEAPTLRRALPLGGTLAVSAHLDSGFVAAFLAVAAVLVADLVRRSWARASLLGAALAVGALSLLVHPSGPAALLHPLDYLHDPRVREVFWNVPGLGGTDFTTLAGRLVEGPLLVVLGLALTGRAKPRLSDGLLLLGFAHAALTLERAVPFLAVAVAGPLAAGLASVLPGRPGSEEPRLVRGAPFALGAGLALFAALGSSSTLPPEQRDAIECAEQVAPVASAGKLWNELDAGGALAWTLAGRERVWIDARHDLHAAAGTWRKHAKIAAATAPWEDLVDRTRTDLVVARRDSPLDVALRARAWRVVHATPTFIVLSRR